jgi:predicted phage tail protein
MQTVYLNGGIEKFGKKWEVHCKTLPDIFKLISCQTPGFREYLLEAADKGIDFQIQRGKEFVNEDSFLLSLKEEDIVITEMPTGSKGGTGKVLAAVAIVAAIIMFPQVFAGTATKTLGTQTVTVYSGLNAAGMVAASLAVNLALSGVTELLSPGPETDGAETNEAYLFDGPVNNVKQGLPVPVAYGELIVGGAVISSSFSLTPFSNGNSTGFIQPLLPRFTDSEGIPGNITFNVDPVVEIP